MANSSIYNRLFPSSIQKGGVKLNNNIFSILKEKQLFLILVFANLILQLGITYYIFLKSNLTNKKYLWPIAIALFIVIIIIIMVPMPIWLKWIVFTIFSILEGLLLSLLKTPTNSSIIQGSILSALSIFSLMVIIGTALIAFGINLGNKFGMVLLFLLLLLIIFQLVSAFFSTLKGFKKIFAFAGLLLFSVYVIYDTNIILQKNYYGDFVTASMDYYLDIINMILDIFNLNSN